MIHAGYIELLIGALLGFLYGLCTLAQQLGIPMLTRILPQLSMVITPLLFFARLLLLGFAFYYLLPFTLNESILFIIGFMVVFLAIIFIAKAYSHGTN